MSPSERERKNPSGSRPEEDDESQEHVGRRGFFTEGFRSLLRPLADVVERRLDRVGLPDWETGSRPRPSAGYPVGRPTGAMRSGGPTSGRPVLRPPGAIDEEVFLHTCMSSGECVNACPVKAIQWSRDNDDPREDGKPFIDPQEQACVVCEDLACMHVCPSGALAPLAKEDIRMGLAVLRDDLCVRTQGEDCQICVDKCPIGHRAIEIPYFGSPVEVHASGCTGCGVCQMYCPTEPRAIVIEPCKPGSSSGPGAGSYFPMD